MKLVIDNRSRGWEAHLIKGTPIGIEKLDRGCWLVYRVWGGERAYISHEVTRYGKKERDTRFFPSRASALEYASQEAERYRANIVVTEEVSA